jgi:hypothetical protein
MFKRLKVAGGSGLAFAVLLSLAALYLKPEAATAAQAERQIQIPPARRNHPVLITKITLGDVVVQSGRVIKAVGVAPDPMTPFQADDDWVQNLTLYLFNRTNQTIVHLTVNFSFPETGDGRTVLRRGYMLNLGRVPPPAAFDRNGKPLRQRPESQPIWFRPGQELAIRLGDYIDQIKTNVQPTMPLAALTQLNVDLISAFFADGMQWWPGGFRVPDPQTFTWRRMGADYFPGNMDRKWPGHPWNDQR